MSPRSPCGSLTAFRLRQLASRVLTVDRRVAGASFHEAHEALVSGGIPPGSAFTTVMRVFRAGGMTKDAIYLRGLVDLLAHLRAEGRLDRQPRAGHRLTLGPVVGGPLGVLGPQGAPDL